MFSYLSVSHSVNKRGMHGRGGGMHGRGVMRGRGVCMAGGACVALGGVWHWGVCGIGVMLGRRDGHCSGRYTSYWNAFLLT